MQDNLLGRGVQLDDAERLAEQAQAMAIEQVVTAPRSPWQNA